MTDHKDYARISAMLRGRRDVRIMPLPGIAAEEKVDIGIRILLDYEIDDCRTESIRYIQSRAKAVGLDTVTLLDIDGELLDRELTRQLIYKAVVKPVADDKGEHAPFFPATQAVRTLDSVLVKTLFEAYCEHQDYVNPLRTADVAELQELVDALGKGRRAVAILSEYDAPTLRTLAHILAAELQTLLGPKSNTGLQGEQT